MRTFYGHFMDEMTDILHPDFGSYWGPEGEGTKYCQQAFLEGYEAGKIESDPASDTSNK